MPGLPKDIASYLFGISPLPFWVFAVASTLGRIPGTWVLSAQGAHTASGNYLRVIVLTAIAVAVALPLYYYRNRIVAWLAGWETGTVITVWSWLRRVRQAFGVENGMPAHPQSMKLPRKTGSR